MQVFVVCLAPAHGFKHLSSSYHDLFGVERSNPEMEQNMRYQFTYIYIRKWLNLYARGGTRKPNSQLDLGPIYSHTNSTRAPHDLLKEDSKSCF
jgi:hypothetical protein